MPEQQICVDCRKAAPETDTSYTLIGSKFGWRVARRRDAAGDWLVEWRCPDCWREYKRAHLDTPAGALGIGEPHRVVGGSIPPPSSSPRSADALRRPSVPPPPPRSRRS